MNDTYTLWQLLKEYKIEIPILQRDYAQGRVGKEKLRTNFLSYLKESLQTGRPVQLDFVYGAVSNETLAPLDGQQRLTTLWLLHWYIAYKAGKTNETDVRDKLMRFSYQTRDSSRDFCRRLSEFSLEKSTGTISQFIKDQNWFSNHWIQDPTVQSMLRMLDTIEATFDKDARFGEMWTLLTGSICPITFYFLDLVGLRQSDDLYLKMNARGEQLTDFENFKADLTEYLTDNKESDEYKDFLDLRDGFPIKMDRDWADIFWKDEDGDEAYMAFINRFFLSCVILDKKDGKHKYNGNEFETKTNNEYFDHFYGRSPKDYIGAECTDDSRIDYSEFNVFQFSDGKLPKSILEALKNTLDGYLKFLERTGRDNIEEFTESSWGEPFHFIPKYEPESDDGKKKETTNFKNEEIKQIKKITQNERVLFYAVCRFMEQVEDQDKDTLEKSFQRWMRVVWNLVSDNRIRSITGMVSQIKLIEKLSEGAMDIYTSIDGVSLGNESNTEGDMEDAESKGDNAILKGRLEEEQIKAAKILEDITWEEEFKQYERKALSKGTIRFLFTGANGDIDWYNYTKKGNNCNNLAYLFESAKPDKTSTHAMPGNHLKDFIGHCATWEELKEIIYDSRRDTWIRNLTNTKLLSAVHFYLLKESRTFMDTSAVRKRAYEDLTKTELLNNMKYGAESINGCHLRDDKYGLIALFPDNARSEMKKFVIGDERNNVLADLMDKEGYKCEQRIPSTKLFWGWDLYFTDPDGQRFWWVMGTDVPSHWTQKLYAVNDKGDKLDETEQISKKLAALKEKFGIS